MDYLIGLMSGTSMDGVDCALIKTDGKFEIDYIASESIHYSSSFHIILKASEFIAAKYAADLDKINENFSAELQQYCAEHYIDFDHVQLSFQQQTQLPLILASIIDYSTQLHLQVIQSMLARAKINATQIKAIGYHGQTLYHNAYQKISWQMGKPQWLANQINIPVVFNFRQQDLEHGGHGAPLAPVFHQALVKKNKLQPAAVINCGGIANVTLVTDQDLIAYDAGPGNVLLDRYVKITSQFETSYDQDGKIALRGEYRQELIDCLQEQSCLLADFYQKLPPKSLDSYDLFLPEIIYNYDKHDVCYNLAYFTAMNLVTSLQLTANDFQLKNIILAGGGWHHPVIKASFEKLISQQFKGVEIFTADNLHWHNQSFEAQLFAYLAARHVDQLPLTFPSTTGVAQDCLGGEVYLPQ